MSRRTETSERRKRDEPRTYNLDERDFWARDDRMAEADEQRQATDRFAPKDGLLPPPLSPCIRCGCAESRNGWYHTDGGYECWECAVFGEVTE